MAARLQSRTILIILTDGSELNFETEMTKIALCLKFSVAMF